MTQRFSVVVFHMWNSFGVVVFYRSMVNWRGDICPEYMCILLYVKLIRCSGIPYIYGQLEEGLGICAFCYMWDLFGVVVFHRSMVNWRRGTLVYVHSAICETYMVLWYSIDLWSIGGGLGICAFCYMQDLFGVVVFHRSMVDWRRVHVP